MGDEELVLRINDGDVEAFERLIQRYQGLVFGVALGQLNDIEDARDVSQDVFVRAFVRLGQLREPGRLGSWLRQIALNECRALVVRRRGLDRLEEDSAWFDPRSTAHDRAALRQALGAIDEASRVTVVLFYLHDYSMKEIAAFLEEPETTIKSRLRNARAKLRKEMEEKLEEDLKREALPSTFAARVVAIIKAVERGDEEATRALLREDPRLATVSDERGVHTALHIAAASGNAPLVELLLANGADPNAHDTGDNATPLHYAAERGWIEVVRLLVEAGTDVNWTQDMHELGPLGWALAFEPSQMEVANYLVEHGARIEIFPAIALGRLDLVKQMVEADRSVADRRRAECDGRQSTVDFATSKRQFEIGRYLAGFVSRLSLQEAAGLGELPLVGERLEGGDLGDALHSAVNAGQIEAARFLLEHGVDPNATRFGRSPIFSCLDNEAMCRMLLVFGADLEFKDPQWKSTALGWAVFFGRGESVRIALRLGAEVGEHLIGLAQSGERGELRRYSPAGPSAYREVVSILRDR